MVMGGGGGGGEGGLTEGEQTEGVCTHIDFEAGCTQADRISNEPHAVCQ